MLKLYYNPNSRAARIRWLLEELEAPHQLVHMDTQGDDCERPEYRKVHPLGLLPAIEEDGGPLFETGAILLHLADRHPKAGLAFEPGSRERALVTQWLFFVATEIEPALSEIYYNTEALPEAERVASNLAWGREQFASRSAVLERALDGKQYLVGGRFSVADLVVASVMDWAQWMKLADTLQNLLALKARCGARPAAMRAEAL